MRVNEQQKKKSTEDNIIKVSHGAVVATATELRMMSAVSLSRRDEAAEDKVMRSA